MLVDAFERLGRSLLMYLGNITSQMDKSPGELTGALMCSTPILWRDMAVWPILSHEMNEGKERPLDGNNPVHPRFSVPTLPPHMSTP